MPKNPSCRFKNSVLIYTIECAEDDCTFWKTKLSVDYKSMDTFESPNWIGQQLTFILKTLDTSPVTMMSSSWHEKSEMSNWGMNQELFTGQGGCGDLRLNYQTFITLW